MKFSPKVLFLLAAFAAASCASKNVAPNAAHSDLQKNVDEVSVALSNAQAKQYDHLAPKQFQRATDLRNSAAEGIREGKDSEKIASDIALARASIETVNTVGNNSGETLKGVLESRQYAVQARAPQFAEKEFHSADKELDSIGHELEQNKYSLNAEQLGDLQKAYGKAELIGRTHIEIGDAKLRIEQAKSNKAAKVTPQTFEIARARLVRAENAIAVAPHNASQYSAAVNEANAASMKLTEVLEIARTKDTSEAGALTIWDQEQALRAQRAALANEKSTTAAKEAELNQQSDSIANLSASNKKYASKEELLQKIEEVKATISPDEAEVMKDGKNIVVRLKNMRFATNRSELPPASFETLQKVESLIAAVPAEQVTVEGHTDATGSNARNKALSEQRAEAVKSYLVSQGLSEDLKLATEGHGSDRPITTNKTKKGRAMNRRVDIVIETPVVL